MNNATNKAHNGSDQVFESAKDANGQATYKYYCRKCGRQWYSIWSCGSTCPNCGTFGTNC